ncbi:alpha/beta hydrolase [Gibbsiella quercinecans]|uniref:alpha/beta hydrolase n=1 Tax=Gibbsiella quercinecans TaxID=929813 RepID=UPI00242FA082|nr:dienelactone hydrolase family protein [Gibbsiella quercinecans]
MTPSLIIFLHGVGSRGDDFTQLAQIWQQRWPNARFAMPNAPWPFNYGGGYQWFSVDGVTENNRLERIVAARAAFDQTIAQFMAQYGLADRPQQVVLVGFSQGSIMALDTVASGRSRYGAIVAFSGRLVPPAAAQFALDTPVALIHGNADNVIPWQESERAQHALQQAGVDSELHVLPGLGHSLSATGVSLAETFIARVGH